MSDKLGPLAFGKRDEMIFLGREIGEQRNYSDDVAKMIDEEVRAFVEHGYARAMQVLTEYKGKLMALADKLIAEETVESEEFEKIFDDLPPKENLHGIVLAMPGFPGFPAAPGTPTAPTPPETMPPAAPSPEPSPS
jgi:cell division protease FtsH